MKNKNKSNLEILIDEAIALSKELKADISKIKSDLSEVEDSEDSCE